MTILIDNNTRVVVQGITGRQGTFHTGRMLAYGTKVVAGTNPKRAGEEVHGVPVFATVAEAVAETGANCSIISVPAPSAAAAIVAAQPKCRSVIVWPDCSAIPSRIH
ncbi:MAG: hypothetical protein H6651_13250 [Ardenticatenales bacterium]|nr:hypothetical protein [Ardenticatenales bacterium]